ncbi:MAG TPA: hypothetical protein VM345_20240 [Acidimicrobiales bacterium]|nr:hypothetical protein [Acidimicrobiales bacterium]
MSDRLDRVLADDYVAGVEDLSIDEVRARRAECQEIEVGLSYARRIVQGRLDIIHAEAQRRSSGSGPSSNSELVDRLEKGEMLGDQARPAGFGRLPTTMGPGDDSDEYLAEADAVAGADVLANVSGLDDAAVQSLAESLGEVERSLSQRRRQVFERIDIFQGEIVRRYKSGIADPDSLLA